MYIFGRDKWQEKESLEVPSMIKLKSYPNMVLRSQGCNEKAAECDGNRDFAAIKNHKKHRTHW